MRQLTEVFSRLVDHIVAVFVGRWLPAESYHPNWTSFSIRFWPIAACHEG